LKMQMLNNIYLFIVSCDIKYHTYTVELEAIKASEGRRVLLSRLQNIAEEISPTRSKKGEREADHSTVIRCEQ
jgi:hypothetical protein